MSTLSPSENLCLCHFIDGNKTRILLWKHKTSPNTYLLKISNQLFLSLARVDKNGQTYWKFKNIYESENSANNSTEFNALEKFTQRQIKTSEINHEPNQQSESTQP